MRRAFHTLDVFTQTPFAGNAVAVVLDAEDLPGGRMQAIAREFNLSETVFVLPPQNPVNTARLRIFTPGVELAFAGHPTIGAAALIAELRAADLLARGELSLVLEEGAGPVSCSVWRASDGTVHASLAPPQAPEEITNAPPAPIIAQALSLEPEDIGFDRHVPSVWSAGTPLIFVPIATRAAIERAQPNLRHWPDLGPPERRKVFLYAKQTTSEEHHIHARMFAPDFGVPEDPATGSAAAAFAGVAVAAERPPDGVHSIMIEQGEEMGRASLIGLTVTVAGGILVQALVSGATVRVSDGALRV